MRALHPKIHTVKIGKGVKLFVAPGGLTGVTYTLGSVDLGDAVSPRQYALSTLAAMLFDEGTRRRSKKEIHDFLDDRGARIDFSREGRHLVFSVRALRKNIPELYVLVGEMLREPLFAKAEFEIAKKRFMTVLHQDKENTGSMARIAFWKSVYPKTHPNFAYFPEEMLAVVRSLTRKDLVAFWQHAVGTGELLLVCVGDTTVHGAASAATKAFHFWQGLRLDEFKTDSAFEARPQTKEVELLHKTSIDIILGSRLGIRRSHKDFYTLAVLMGALGSDFSARLFQEVREKRGLTYGIYATLGGFVDNVDGHWNIWATFAPSLLNKGRKAIADVLNELVTKGLTPKEVREAKQKMIGRYLIDLAVPTKFAHAILSLLHNEGHDLSQLSAWRDKIQSVTNVDVARAIKKYIHPDKLSVAMAGTFPKRKK